MIRKLGKLINTFVGMSGLRLDHAAFRADFVVWVVLFALGGLAYGHVFLWGDVPLKTQRSIAIWYAVAVWTAYYAGNSLVLGTPIRERLCRRFGEVRARRFYNAGIGIVFQHQGMAHGAIFAAWPMTMTGTSYWMLYTAGLGMVIFGAVVKIWATWLTSLDIYYYNDMFIGRPAAPQGELIRHGPYRWFKNPMYGVGNLQAYGSAMMALSWQGLFIAGLFHASLYGFYFLLERPFVKRTYALDNVQD